MKILKILSVLLALVMTMGCMVAIPVSAETLQEGGTVYVGGTGAVDTNDGLSESTPVTSITKAQEIIDAADVTKATVKLLSAQDMPVGESKADVLHSAMITYTGSTLTFTATTYLNGPTTFSDIQLNATAANRNLIVQGHKFVVDSSVTVQDATKTFKLWGAGNNITVDSVDMTVNAGSWSYIYTVGQYGGTVKGDTKVVINGQAFSGATLCIGGSDNAGRTFNVKGKTSIYATSGALQRIIVGSTVGNTSTNNNIDGNVDIHIGDFTMKSSGQLGIFSNTESNLNINGKVIIDYSGATENAKNTWSGAFNTINSKETDYADKFVATDCSVAGAQQSLDGTAARFIIGIRDYQVVQEGVSVKIVAKNSEGAVVKEFNKSITKVYNSVTANVEGVNTTVTAKEMSANFIMAVTLTKIPNNLDIKAFEITATVDGTAAPVAVFDYPIQ